MEIVVLTEEFYPNTSGGAHTQWQFCIHATDKGHSVTVITPRDGDVPADEEVRGVRIIRPYPSRPSSLPAYAGLSLITRLVYSLLTFIYMVHYVRKNEIDGLFAGTHGMHWVASIISKIYSGPLVSYVSLSASTRGDSPSRMNLIFEWINFRLFMGDTVYCRTSEISNKVENISSSDTGVLQGFLHENKIRATEEAFQADEQLSSAVPVSEDKIRIAFVGRLVPIKSPTKAINIISNLPDTYELIMIGDGPEMESVKISIDRLDVSQRVHLVGEVEHTTALQIIAESNYLLVTSEAESLCGVALEGLSLSTPVVSTPVGILPDLNHQNLHIAPVDTLSNVLLDIEPGSTPEVDEEVLSRFSVSNFGEAILAEFRESNE